MFTLYQNKKYKDVCTMGFNNFYTNKKDENFLSMYAFACLYADYIDRLAVPITMLKFSQSARSNAAYFSVILMQKKLLYHALVDDYDISNLKFPTTDYILSKVFNLYSKIGKHAPRAFYLFEDPDDKKLTYKLYILKDEKLNKMIIEEFYDTITLERHIYW
jgi:hypothetical protein